MRNVAVSILVTGGAGFIGSNFCHYIRNKYPNYNIVVLDALTYAGNIENLPVDYKKINTMDDFQFWYGDVMNGSLVDSLMSKVDYCVHFAAQSVSKDTLVPVHTGYQTDIIEIEDLFNKLSARNKVVVNEDGVECIEVPGVVSTIGYSNGMGKWRRIKYITRHKYDGDMFRLRQKWGEITVTPNHSIYSSNGALSSPTENPELLSMRKLDYNKNMFKDRIVVKNKNCRVVDGRVFAVSCNGQTLNTTSVLRVVEKDNLKKLVKFLGFYCAEGSSSFCNADGTHSNHSYTVSLSNKKRGLLEELKKDVESICDAHGSISKTSSVYQLSYSSKALYNIVREWCGVGSNKKRVPPFVYTLQREYQELFLEWYLLGGGNEQKYVNSSSWRAVSTSKLLITGVGFLCTLLGKDYTMHYRKEGNGGVQKEAYDLKIVGHYGHEELNKEIQKFYYGGYVYDLTVEDTENFCSGMGLIVAHNTHVTRSIYDNKVFFDTDVLGTQVIANSVCKYAKNVKRFIHISTSEVYGTAESAVMDETHPLNPASPYAAAKVGADRLVYSYWRTYGIPAVIVRPFNNYGPRQHLEKLIPRLITNSLMKEKFRIHGDGSAARDFIYVDDTCAAIDFLLHYDSPDYITGQVFNVGSGIDRSINSIADDIIEITGGNPGREHVGNRPGQVVRHTADSRKLKSLGWLPVRDWYEGLSDTVRWYTHNSKIWEKQLWMRDIPIVTASGKKELH